MPNPDDMMPGMQCTTVEEYAAVVATMSMGHSLTIPLHGDHLFPRVEVGIHGVWISLGNGQIFEMDEALVSQLTDFLVTRPEAMQLHEDRYHSNPDTPSPQQEETAGRPPAWVYGMLTGFVKDKQISCWTDLRTARQIIIWGDISTAGMHIHDNGELNPAENNHFPTPSESAISVWDYDTVETEIVDYRNANEDLRA